MKSVFSTSIKLAVFLLGVSVASLHAESFYIYADVSRSDIDLGSGVDDDDTGVLGLGAGFNLNEHFAVQAGYQDVGEVGFSGGGASVDIEGESWQAVLIGSYPLSEQAKIYGQLGVDFWDVDVDYVNVPGFGTGSESDDGSDPFFGIGVSFAASEQLEIYGEYQLHEWGDVDIDIFSLGIRFHLSNDNN